MKNCSVTFQYVPRAGSLQLGYSSLHLQIKVSASLTLYCPSFRPMAGGLDQVYHGQKRTLCTPYVNLQRLQKV